MSRLFTSLADKAQSAINQTGLADKLPTSVTNALQSQSSKGQLPGATPDHGPQYVAAGGAQQPGQAQSQDTVDSMANATGAGGRHRAFESLQHSFRALQVQYSSQVTEEVKQLQLMITASKGVSLDHQAVARDTQAFSKELYAWGQKEKDDLKDVSDRLAWINFTHGTLEANLGSAFEAARAPLKAVRDAETALHPKRNIRKGINLQIQQIKNESKSPQAADKIAELQLRLQKLEAEDGQAERDVEIEKRKALNAMESKKWAAIREYAEKLLLLCQASDRVLDELPSLPPSPGQPYTGGENTGRTRATLQHALDNFKPGNILLEAPPSQLRPVDHKSFGETHAVELSSIPSGTTAAAPHPATPPVTSPHATVGQLAGHAAGTSPVPIPADGQSYGGGGQSYGTPAFSPAPMNPGALNHTPAYIPGAATEPPVLSPPHVVAALAPEIVSPVPDAPTIAETGLPIASPYGGPGPAAGSLAGGHVSEATSPPPAVNSGAPSHYETAEEEKKRLEREERDRSLYGGPAAASSSLAGGPAIEATSPPPAAAAAAAPSQYETAEEEKKRLEREERDRILRGSRHGRDPPVRRNEDGSFPDASANKDDEGAGPPPYQPY
ncbi:Eisosome component PIL1-domain-containing protein [Auriculariales sp. MPI-PUGE-AT-0066]|nr:Eisosome component PIL1-domain-containing protein [Auriculariales sp. MPI-PUGE-AT-0066]